jgi:hypothetical protein
MAKKLEVWSMRHDISQKARALNEHLIKEKKDLGDLLEEEIKVLEFNVRQCRALLRSFEGNIEKYRELEFLKKGFIKLEERYKELRTRLTKI